MVRTSVREGSVPALLSAALHARVLEAPPIVASTFNAPVPCSNTVWATVPLRGFLAMTIGSNAGLSAVPRPRGICGLPHPPQSATFRCPVRPFVGQSSKFVRALFSGL